MFLTGYEKITVQQDFELRKTIRGAGGNYKVVKNNLAEKASEGTAAEELMKDLAGMTSMAFTEKDPVALAKALTAYAKTESGVHFQGRHGGRPRHRYRRDSGARHDAAEGRDLVEVVVPD